MPPPDGLMLSFEAEEYFTLLLVLTLLLSLSPGSVPNRGDNLSYVHATFNCNMVPS